MVHGMYLEPTMFNTHTGLNARMIIVVTSTGPMDLIYFSGNVLSGKEEGLALTTSHYGQGFGIHIKYNLASNQADLAKIADVESECRLN